MSSANHTDRREESWWQILRSATGPIRPEAAEAVLAEYRPLGFVPRDTPDDAPVSSVEDLVARMQVALLEAELKRVAQVADREAADRADFESAFARPDADMLVTDGDWKGFTHGEAAAWCWNLFHYELRHVDVTWMTAVGAMKHLSEGGLPSVFKHSERARTLRDSGLTARTYREHREALGDLTLGARRERLR